LKTCMSSFGSGLRSWSTIASGRSSVSSISSGISESIAFRPADDECSGGHGRVTPLLESAGNSWGFTPYERLRILLRGTCPRQYLGLRARMRPDQVRPRCRRSSSGLLKESLRTGLHAPTRMRHRLRVGYVRNGRRLDHRVNNPQGKGECRNAV
jgi:hypothetical protein